MVQKLHLVNTVATARDSGALLPGFTPGKSTGLGSAALLNIAGTDVALKRE